MKFYINPNNLTCLYYSKEQDELMLGFYGNFSYVYYLGKVASDLLDKIYASIAEIPEEEGSHIVYYHPLEVLIINKIDLAALDQSDNKLRVWFNSGNDFLEIHSLLADEIFKTMKQSL